MSDKYHVLIVGAGSIGERHLRCFLATGRAVCAVVEINAALREKIAQQYEVESFASLEAALEAKETHPGAAAVVATPANLHVEQATQLAAAGRHVLLEKPLSIGTDGIGQLDEIARQKGTKLAVAYVYRTFPALAEMRQAIHNGQFGRPVQVVAVNGQNFPTYRPAYRQTYYVNHATGGGAIQDALTHVLNAGEWLVGPIDRLVADAAHRVLPGSEVEDTAHVLARHGEVLASYSLNQHQAPNESSITVICDRGTARWEGHRQRWRWMTAPDEPWHDQPQVEQSRDAGFIAQANHFLDAIAGKQPPLCSLAEGLQTLRVNLAALKSARDGSWQRVEGR